MENFKIIQKLEFTSSRLSKEQIKDKDFLVRLRKMKEDNPKKSFERFTDYRIHGPIIISCILLITFFLYPSFLNDIVSKIIIF